MRSIALMNTSLKFWLPLNIRCSNRCAKPVLPGFSFLDPTWYQVSMATTGVLWSSCTSKVRPLDRTNFVYGICGIGMSTAAGFTVGALAAAAGLAAGWAADWVNAAVGSSASVAAAASRRRVTVDIESPGRQQARRMLTHWRARAAGCNQGGVEQTKLDASSRLP